jgi:hypothetical protein
MKSAISLALLFTLSTFLTTSAATQKKPLTNDDVVKMVKAGLDQNVITQTIAASPQEFDLSSDALIHLKEEGVPDSVVQAMVSRASARSTPSDIGESQGTVFGVFLIDGSNRIPMKYSPATGDFRGVPVPFTKHQAMRTLNGARASLRAPSAPSFELSLRPDLNPEDAANIVRLTCKSGHREISVLRGGDFRHTSRGFDAKDIVPSTISELEVQRPGSIRKAYRVTLTGPLAAGEYAFVVQRETYYDFGVDK